MKFPMLCLLFLIAIVVVLAQGEEDCTLYKYATFNTFRTEKSFSFSCYGVGADCEVYYAPLGSGCNGDSLTLIGTVPENETQVLTSEDEDEGFELGCMFCSKHQIGVYYVHETLGYIIPYLPRATEAGTKFRSGFVLADGGIVTQCVVSALLLPANVRVVLNGEVQSFSIDPYSFDQFETPVITDSSPSIISVTVDSDNPVIVSCARANPDHFTTFQPISPEPLVVNAGDSDSVSVVISNCSTNALIEDFSKVNFLYVNEAGSPCEVTPSNLGDQNGMTAQESCVFYLEPLEDVCVGMMLFAENGALVTMGMPESKLSTRFANFPDIEFVNLISFSETTCTGFFDSAHEGTVLSLDWLGDDLSGKVSFLDWVKPFNDFSWAECENPVLLVSREYPARVPILSGYQSKKLWQPYFDSICPTKPPSSSDARSLVTSWVVFFAAYFFSSSLLV